MSDRLRVVAIDGVLGAGKTTVARRLADRLSLEYLDTGAMYRSIAVACLRAGHDVVDATSLEGESGDRLRSLAVSTARSSMIEVRTDAIGTQRVLLDGLDVSADIRSPAAARAASVIATIGDVRTEMVERQRGWARARGGGVLEGRDIATVVFPDAAARIFLTADVHERARRRHAEQPDRPYDEVVADLEWRDANDSSREVAPLTIAVGATVIDTTGLSLDEVVVRAASVAEDGFRTHDSAPTEPAPAKAKGPVSVGKTVGPSLPAVGRVERVLWTTVRTVVVALAKLYFRVSWENSANMPKSGPVILAPVHRSNVDTVFVPMLFRRRVRFLGKASMWKFATLGRLFNKLGAIKVERGAADREAMNLCIRALQAGEPVVVYPEGTRKEGPVVDGLFDGVAWLAARTQAPIVPIGIGGSALVMGRGDRFPKPKRVHLIVGTPIAPPPNTGRSGLRACTAQLQSELQALFDDAQLAVQSPRRKRRRRIASGAG